MSRSRHTVTVSQTVEIARPPSVVFDYTQDYDQRTEWDSGILEATALAGDDGAPRVRVRMRGLGRVTVEYRLFRRPERTSAAFTEPESRWMVGGGGSWSYEPVDAGTRWTQTNTIELRPGLAGRLLAPLVERSLRSSMHRAMTEAKRILEAAGAGTG